MTDAAQPVSAHLQKKQGKKHTCDGNAVLPDTPEVRGAKEKGQNGSQEGEQDGHGRDSLAVRLKKVGTVILNRNGAYCRDLNHIFM